jgi:hypothetical protein
MKTNKIIESIARIAHAVSGIEAFVCTQSTFGRGRVTYTAWVQDPSGIKYGPTEGGIIEKGADYAESLMMLHRSWVFIAEDEIRVLSMRIPYQSEALCDALRGKISRIEAALIPPKTCSMCDDTYVVVNSMGDQRECDYC